MLHAELGHPFQDLAAVNDAGRVAGIVDDDHLCLVRDMLGQDLAVDLEAVLRPKGDGDHDATRLRNHVLIVHKGGGEDDHLVPGIHIGQEGHADRFGSATGQQDFRGRVIVQTEVVAQVLGDLGAQSHRASVRRVVGLIL